MYHLRVGTNIEGSCCVLNQESTVLHSVYFWRSFIFTNYSGLSTYWVHLSIFVGSNPTTNPTITTMAIRTQTCKWIGSFESSEPSHR